MDTLSSLRQFPSEIGWNHSSSTGNMTDQRGIDSWSMDFLIFSLKLLKYMGFRVTLEAQTHILLCFLPIKRMLWRNTYTRHFFIFYVWFIKHFLAIVIWLYDHNRCYADENRGEPNVSFPLSSVPESLIDTFSHLWGNVALTLCIWEFGEKTKARKKNETVSALGRQKGSFWGWIFLLDLNCY